MILIYGTRFNQFYHWTWMSLNLILYSRKSRHGFPLHVNAYDTSKPMFEFLLMNSSVDSITMICTYGHMICDKLVLLLVYDETSPFKGLICKQSTLDPSQFWLGSVLNGAKVVQDDHPNVLSMKDALIQKRGWYASFTRLLSIPMLMT